MLTDIFYLFYNKYNREEVCLWNTLMKQYRQSPR